LKKAVYIYSLFFVFMLYNTNEEQGLLK